MVANVSIGLTYTVTVLVIIGIRRNEEQKVLAGLCCFNAVTSLFTAGHNIGGVVVAAGIGEAPAIATKAATMSASMMSVNDRKPTTTRNPA